MCIQYTQKGHIYLDKKRHYHFVLTHVTIVNLLFYNALLDVTLYIFKTIKKTHEILMYNLLNTVT